MTFYAGILIGLCLGGPFGLILGCILAASSRASREEEKRWAKFGRLG